MRLGLAAFAVVAVGTTCALLLRSGRGGTGQVHSGRGTKQVPSAAPVIHDDALLARLDELIAADRKLAERIDALLDRMQAQETSGAAAAPAMPQAKPGKQAAQAWQRMIHQAESRLVAERLARGEAYLQRLIRVGKLHVEKDHGTGDLGWRTQLEQSRRALAEAQSGKIRTLEDLENWIGAYGVDVR